MERARLMAMLGGGDKSSEPRAGVRPAHLPWTPIPLEVGSFSAEKSVAPPPSRGAPPREVQPQPRKKSGLVRTSRAGPRGTRKRAADVAQKEKAEVPARDEVTQDDERSSFREETLRSLVLQLPAVAAALITLGKVVFGGRGGRQWKTAAGREWSGS